MIYKGCESMKVLKAVAVVGSAFAFGLSALTPFSASADALLVNMNPAVWHDLLGDNFDAQFLLTDLSYSNQTFTYQRSFTIAPYDMDFDVDFLQGVTVLAYRSSVPGMWSGIYTVDIPFSIPNASYMDFSFLPWTNLGDIRGNSASDFRQYAFGLYDMNGSTVTVQPQINAAGTHGASLRLGAEQSASGGFSSAGTSCTRVYYNDTGSQLDYLELSVNYGYTESGYTWLWITCPVINSDWEDPVYPNPDPDLPAYVNVDGEASGSISENSSGGYDINYNYNIQVPDYNGVLNPSLNGDQSSRMGIARDTVDEYHTAEEGLLSEADDALSSLPDMEFDETLIEDAENPFSEFFGINIVGIMVFWVGAIAFISYILFGKWV